MSKGPRCKPAVVDRSDATAAIAQMAHGPIDFTAGKADGNKLLNSLLPFAEELLQKHREFFPFGGVVSPEGAVTHQAAYDGQEHPPSQVLIDLLHRAHGNQALQGEIRASAVVYDIRTVPPGRSEKQDAIAVAIDHVSGYSAVVIFPYSFNESDELLIDEPFAVQGAGSIFPHQMTPISDDGHPVSSVIAQTADAGDDPSLT
jgi:hypothetical protein